VIAAVLVAAALTTVETDARHELLGVVQLLSGRRAEVPLEPALERKVRQRFAAFRDHPAVALYAEACLRPGGDACGVQLLYYSQPPELKLERPWRMPNLRAESEKERFQRFLWELRDFARASRFMEFHAERAAELAAVEKAARAELGGTDPLAVTQAYLGLSLEAKSRYVVSPLYTPRRYVSYIVPYPDPLTLPKPPAEGFAVHSLFAWVPAEKRPAGAPGVPVFDKRSAALWHEPLFVLLDPAFPRYGLPPCPEEEDDCDKARLVSALVERLAGVPARADAAAFARKLREYEADRRRWPTLWDFFPRLFSGKAAKPQTPRSVRELF